MSKVKLTTNTNAIRDILATTYNLTEATYIARSLSGQVVEVMGVEELQDDQGKWGNYMTICDDLNNIYILPMSLVEVVC